ncbi:DNA alkylation repair protein [Parabacteroides pacaensis]|uniref:DNA alkylation repair protein n=1 Tax=Parabacteroides pacaensis TaxID=2086575 RepID=UPI000D0FEEAE|nr:DNA alkylation repair protein [Parabacteroides pacaensis]
MNPIIQQIRQRLRLAMDGAVSASMRAKGVNYKLNFGVTLPRLKEIAADFTPDAALAQELWQQDVRELKILATMLYPKDLFTSQQAGEWVSTIRHIEIAEQFCANLMQDLPFASTCAATWIQDSTDYISITGYILYTRLFIKGINLTPTEKASFLQTTLALLRQPYSYSQQVALTALKRYGRQSREHAREVLDTFAEFRHTLPLEKQEIYNDLKFEFEYSL